MIITKAKHEKIVSLKDADIKLHENKIKGLSKSLYKKIDELESVKEDLKLANTEISMKNDTINELIKDKYSLKERIECQRESLLFYEDMIRDNIDEINRLNKEKARTEEIKRQYREYINKALEITHIEHYATTKDIEKFMSKEGARGIIDLYTLASLM